MLLSRRMKELKWIKKFLLTEFGKSTINSHINHNGRKCVCVFGGEDYRIVELKATTTTND